MRARVWWGVCPRRVGCLCCEGLFGGVQGGHLWWDRHLRGGEQRGLVGGDAGGLRDLAGRSDEGDLVDADELAGEADPGVPGALLGHPDEEGSEPEQQDIGADAFVEAVVDRTQVEAGLHGAEGPFGLGPRPAPWRDAA